MYPLSLSSLPCKSSRLLDICENLVLQRASQARNQSSSKTPSLNRLPDPSQHQQHPTTDPPCSGGTGNCDSSCIGLSSWRTLCALLPKLVYYSTGLNGQRVIPDGRIWFLVPVAECTAVQPSPDIVKEECYQVPRVGM